MKYEDLFFLNKKTQKFSMEKKKKKKKKMKKKKKIECHLIQILLRPLSVKGGKLTSNIYPKYSDSVDPDQTAQKRSNLIKEFAIYHFISIF